MCTCGKSCTCDIFCTWKLFIKHLTSLRIQLSRKYEERNLFIFNIKGSFLIPSRTCNLLFVIINNEINLNRSNNNTPKKSGTPESNVLLVTNILYRINSVIRMATMWQWTSPTPNLQRTCNVTQKRSSSQLHTVGTPRHGVLLSHKDEQYIRLTVYAPLTFRENLRIYTVEERLHLRSVYILFQVTERFYKHIVCILLILTENLCKCNVCIHTNSQNFCMNIYCTSN